MSLLHSFYCWGHAGVVLLSTLFFHLAGIENWKFLALLWALIPIANALLFTRVPLASLIEEGERGLKLKELFSLKLFWILLIMMICAGASEQAVSQWASTFAEQGLQISKTAGDLAGPMAFALLMGTSRLFYGKYGDRINLDRFMAGSCLLCILSYLGISLIPIPQVSLIACALCGLSVGIMWPGTFSKGFRGSAPGRDRHVCPAGPGRRYRLFRRSHGGGHGVRRPGRQPENGRAGRDRISSDAFGRDRLLPESKGASSCMKSNLSVERDKDGFTVIQISVDQKESVDDLTLEMIDEGLDILYEPGNRNGRYESCLICSETLGIRIAFPL